MALVVALVVVLARMCALAAVARQLQAPHARQIIVPFVQLAIQASASRAMLAQPTHAPAAPEQQLQAQYVRQMELKYVRNALQAFTSSTATAKPMPALASTARQLKV